MKRFILAVAAVASLAACETPMPGVGGIPTAPAQIADSVVLDEQAAIGVELAYKAVRVALELATDAGLIKGQRAVAVAALDNRAYGLVQATRAAYRVGNATGYLAAATEARAAVEQMLSALKGN